MKILHIYDHTEPLHSGYVFRSRALRMALEQAGNQCDILSMPRHYADNKTIYTSPVEIIDNKTYYRTSPTKTKLPIIRELADIFKTAFYIKKLIQENKYDYLHVHSPVLGVFSALLARFLLRQKKLRIVYEIRAFWEDAAVDHGTLTQGNLKYRTIHFLETFACKMVDQVYPICASLKHDLVERGIDKNKITIIPNIVTENAFINNHTAEDIKTLKKAYNFKKGDYILGFIGSFYAYEGLEDLMPIMLYYKENNIPIKLLLVGGGSTESVLKEYVTQHGLENHVIFTGRIPHEQINKHYKLCTSMIYPRRSMRLTETVTPLKPLEAATTKTPVILSDIGGHRELLVDKKTGIFIDNFTHTTKVAEKIKDIITDSKLLKNIADNAFDYVKKYRNPNDIIKRYYKKI